MTDALFSLAKDHPIAVPLAFVLVLLIGAWHVATTYTNFQYMRKNMVSKKDLEIALLKAQEHNDARYIRHPSSQGNGEVLNAGQIIRQHRKGKGAGGD